MEASLICDRLPLDRLPYTDWKTYLHFLAYRKCADLMGGGIEKLELRNRLLRERYYDNSVIRMTTTYAQL